MNYFGKDINVYENIYWYVDEWCQCDIGSIGCIIFCQQCGNGCKCQGCEVVGYFGFVQNDDDDNNGDNGNNGYWVFLCCWVDNNVCVILVGCWLE